MLLLVDKFYDTAVIQTKCSRIDILAVGVVTHNKDFRLIRIVDVKREIITRHHPIKGRTYHTGKRYLGTGYLPLQLILCSALPSVHKGRKIIG